MSHDRIQNPGNSNSRNKSVFAIINKRKYLNRYTREHGTAKFK